MSKICFGCAILFSILCATALYYGLGESGRDDIMKWFCENSGSASGDGLAAGLYY